MCIVYNIYMRTTIGYQPVPVPVNLVSPWTGGSSIQQSLIAWLVQR